MSNKLKEFNNICDIPENTIAVDGFVYSLDGWKHPGGHQIMIFGGNDVSVQYKMIHPFHNDNMRNKMPIVGKLVNYDTDYTFGSDFEKELKSEVSKIVPPHKMYATPGFKLRLLLYSINYIVLIYYYINYGASILLCTLLGFSEALIGLNVQHDANHGAIFKNPLLNDFFGFGADLIGGNKYLWLQQHWTHHAYTNDIVNDPDAKSIEPFVFLHNYKDKNKKQSYITKYQHIYIIPLFALYWLSSIISTEFLTNIQYSVDKYSKINFNNSYIKKARYISIILRVIHIYIKIITQLYFYDIYMVLLYVLYGSVISSLSLAIPFSLSHNFIDVDREPKNKDWYKAQVETSCTYGGKYIGYLCGGLNYQIEHHLFPRMNSAWYPYIRDSVERVCKKHNVKYTYYPTFIDNFRSTLKYIKNIGELIDIKKEYIIS